jgi:ribosomal protein S14
MYDRSEVPAAFACARDAAADKATERQVKFILGLLEERDLFASPKWFDAYNAMDAEEYAAAMERFKAAIPQLTKKAASAWIEKLLALPKKPKAKRDDTDVPAVPAGRYALEDTADDLNPVKFYKVNHGKKGGRWEGFIFVDRFVSDETFPVKGSQRVAVLKAIAANPLEAAQRFGREENRCCICGRRLTRRLSRHLGIGPVCGERNGWINADALAVAREEIRAMGLDPNEEVADEPETTDSAVRAQLAFAPATAPEDPFAPGESF